MEQFYIDRQFGLAIWIDVDKGIVQRVYNGSNHFNAKMEENYKGKTISFLRDDFVTKMKPVFHCVHPEALSTAKLQAESKKTQVRQLWNQITSLETPEDEKVNLQEKVEALQIEQYAAERIVEEEKERIMVEHAFAV